jgi:hypothetical protein
VTCHRFRLRRLDAAVVNQMFDATRPRQVAVDQSADRSAHSKLAVTVLGITVSISREANNGPPLRN